MKYIRMLRVISNMVLSIWCWFTILLLIGLLISYKINNTWIIDNIYPIYEKTLIVIFLIVAFSATANAVAFSATANAIEKIKGQSA